MENSNYHLQLGATLYCTKIIMEDTKVVGQRDTKGANKGCLLFESWFSSKHLAESAMDVVADMIDMVETNTKGLFKETIENLTKYWPGGSYLLLRSKPMVPGVRPLISIR